MSQLIHCETCGKEIAKKAEVCPHCGVKRNKRGFFKTTLIVLIVFMFLALIGAINDPDVQSGLQIAGIPECGSPEGIAAAKDDMNMKILQNSMRMLDGQAVVTDEVIDISNANQVAYDEATKTVSCTGVVETKLSGQVPIKYSFRALNDGTIRVETRLAR